MEKKRAILLILLISFFMFSLVLAEDYKFDVKTTKEVFKPEENITFIASLYDSSNNPIDASIQIRIEGTSKEIIELTSQSNKLSEINLGGNVSFGYWKIISKYNDLESNSIFLIEEKELASFFLDGDILTIENIGNTPYIKTIQIAIGDTIGTKEVSLGLGEKTSFRLLAPDGVYNVRISDGKTSLIKSEVSLTGSVIGIVDKKIEESSTPLTGTR